MNSSLEDVEFLARSEHRVTVLDALADGPQSRSDLRELTGASSSTISRMLGEFETRNWVRRKGHWFEATPLGAFVIEGMTTLLDRMETEGKLREAMRWFPTDDVDFEAIRCLSDAEIVLPSESDPLAPIRSAGRQLRTGTRLRFLTTQVTVPYFEIMKQGVVHRDLEVEGVVTPGVHDTLVNDAALAAVYGDLCDSGDVVFFVTEGVPLVLQIIDDGVGIGLVDDSANPRGLVCSDDESVHRWAVDTFEVWRDEAERVCGP